jgi:hypothetical protein
MGLEICRANRSPTNPAARAAARAMRATRWWTRPRDSKASFTGREVPTTQPRVGSETTAASRASPDGST